MNATLDTPDAPDAADLAGATENVRSVEDRMLLRKLAELHEEIISRPDPPAWQWWEVERLADLRRYGPEWDAVGWFGGDKGLLERERVKFLRSAWRLSDCGLVRLTTSGGRLKFIRLTPEGEREAAALAAEAITNATPEPAG